MDQAVIDAALSQWQGMTQTNRYRIRLHHESLVKLPHDTLDKVFVYYHTGIPLSARENIRESLTDEFRFLGLTFQAAKNTLNGIASGLANHFWPGWVARLVVYGHESDFS